MTGELIVATTLPLRAFVATAYAIRANDQCRRRVIACTSSPDWRIPPGTRSGYSEYPACCGEIFKKQIGCLAITDKRALVVADYDRGESIHKTMVVDIATWALEEYPEDELAPAIWLPEWLLSSFRGEILASPELITFRDAQRLAALATK